MKKGMTVNQAMRQLEAIQHAHGREMELLSTSGSINFKFFTFSQQERKREGVKDFVGIVADNGLLL